MSKAEKENEVEESLMDISAWRAIKLEGDARAAWCSHLRHLQSSVSEVGEKYVSGITLWGAQLGTQRRVGIAWTWLRMGREVVALADPMHISCNARLVTADGMRLSQDRALLHLNNIVNALPWQAEVLMKLGGRSSGASAAALAGKRGIGMTAPLQSYA